jgi:sRNA-binding protein
MIRHRQLIDANRGAVKMTTKSDDNIAALAALFPAAFSAEPWRAHRPLKVGIGDELVARGALGAREVNAALKQYVDR